MPSLPPTDAGSATACAAEVAGRATVATRLSGITALRDGGWPESAPVLPRRFLRHADEQTVVGVHAILAAIAALPETRLSLAGHGIVAASCQAGRVSGAQTLVQAKRGGGVAVSTQIVPQGSLHSLAGAVSVGLGMHGPNVGIGGGPEALAEGLCTAFSWLMALPIGACELVWLVITGWDEEPALDAEGLPVTDPICRGVALALARSTASGGVGHDRLVVEFDPSASGTNEGGISTGCLRSLADALGDPASSSHLPPWSLRLPWSATARLSRAPAASARRAA
jgi:hypothetical protein